MSSAVAAKLPKPKLRGHLQYFLRKHITISLVLSGIAGYAWKAAVCDPRKKAYAEFYK